MGQQHIIDLPGTGVWFGTGKSKLFCEREAMHKLFFLIDFWKTKIWQQEV